MQAKFQNVLLNFAVILKAVVIKKLIKSVHSIALYSAAEPRATQIYICMKMVENCCIFILHITFSNKKK